MSPSPEPKAESAESAVGGREPRGEEGAPQQPLPLPRPEGGSNAAGKEGARAAAKVSPALDYESDRYRLVTPRVRL